MHLTHAQIIAKLKTIRENKVEYKESAERYAELEKEEQALIAHYSQFHISLLEDLI